VNPHEQLRYHLDLVTLYNHLRQKYLLLDPNLHIHYYKLYLYHTKKVEHYYAMMRHTLEGANPAI
jgi:predicted transport protein